MDVPQVMLEDLLKFLHNIWGTVEVKKKREKKEVLLPARSNGAILARKIENVRSSYNTSDEQRPQSERPSSQGRATSICIILHCVPG